MKATKVTPQDFLIITSPDDMKKLKARQMAASYAARFRRKKRHGRVSAQPGAALESFLLWRFGNLGAKPDPQKQAKIFGQHKETISQRHMADAEPLTPDIPAGLNPGMSLQQCECISWGSALFYSIYITIR
jgi:hypothetical protein